MKSFWIALSFLTIFPAPKRYTAGLEGLGRAAAWFPLMGALIGGLVALAHFGLEKFLPPLLSAAASVVIWVCLTGGLHLDGLADCCDGLLNASSPERRLEIMKDPHVGTFGVVGLILTITLKISALFALPAHVSWIAVPLAASVARWLLLWLAHQPMARADGMGAAFKRGIRPVEAVIAASIPLGLGIMSGGRGLIAIIVAGLIGVGIVRLARVRLGGMTGDVFGLIVEMAELAALLVFAIQ